MHCAATAAGPSVDHHHPQGSNTTVHTNNPSDNPQKHLRPAMATASAPPAPPRLKPHELGELTTFVSIAHLLHHRNLNQHRHSVWWRSFSTFRRELQHLVAEYQASSLPASAYSTALPAPSKPSRAAKASAKRVVARVAAWQGTATAAGGGMVPRWYAAFADAVASTQFSAIGLVLLAMLARVAQLTGVTAAYAAEAEAMEAEEREGWERKRQMREALDEYAQKDAKELAGAVGAAGGGEAGAGGSGQEEDLGEVIVREGEEREEHAVTGDRSKKDAPDVKLGLRPKEAAKKKKKKKERAVEPEPEPEPEVVEPPKKKKKTKKTRGNAIDDLFAGL